MDCDNDHSDDPDDWLTPFDVAMDFPGVGMIFVYSRSHMKQKGKRGPRTTVPCVFYLHGDNGCSSLQFMEGQADCRLPYFDDGAKDSARFLFG